MNNDIFKVALWDFTRNLKSKTFLVLTVFIPIIIVIIGFVPNFLAFQGEEEPVTLYVIDNAGVFKSLNNSVNALEQNAINLKLAESAKSELKEEAMEKEINGYFVLNEPLSSYQKGPVVLGGGYLLDGPGCN